MLLTAEHPPVLDRPSGAVARHAREIQELAHRFGISDVRVFGSVARGTDTRHSDIDLIAKVESGRGPEDIWGFVALVESMTGFEVDFVIDDEERSSFFDRTKMVWL